MSEGADAPAASGFGRRLREPAPRNLAALAGLVFLSALLLGLAPEPEADPSPLLSARPAEPRERPALPSLFRPDPGTTTRAGRVAPRNVTPADMTAEPFAQGEAPGAFERVEPRAPSPQEAARRAEAERPLLRNAIAVDGASLAVRSAIVKIAGVVPPPLRQRCGEGAASWPCGVTARTELRNFIRGRAVRCDVPESFGDARDTVEASCTLAETDMGDWIVRNGWGEATPGGPYETAEREAKAARRGLWR